MGVIPWSPLAGGWLTGKYRRGQSAPEGSRFSGGTGPGFGRAVEEDRHAPARFDLVDALDVVAREAGLTMTQLALGFVDAHPAVTAAIIGPKTTEQLDDLLTAADVVLDAATLDAIDKIVRPGTDAPGVVHRDGNPVLADPGLRRR
jgi:aryl-alcohol dehydrogenase (NADP+)